VREEVAAWALPRIRALLQRRMRGVETAVIVEAAEDAILRYLNRPPRWKQRAGLLTFLVAIAMNRALTRLAQEGRRTARERALASLQVAVSGAAAVQEGRLELTSVQHRIAKSPSERCFLAVLLHGERKTEAYAQALDVTHLPAAWQRREVKRVRDRLLARARRLRTMT